MKSIRALTLTLISLMTFSATAQTTAFNYSGFLLDGAVPANGSNDLQFTLYATNFSGAPLTASVTLTNQPVTAGNFVVTLDFGDVFDGADRWLEIAARPGGSSGIFTNTFPRQKITAAPQAAFANNGMPPGSITAFGGTNIPAGWILCDGRPLSRTTYARLFNAIGTAWGTTSATNFLVPDMRGLFMRGVDDSPVTGTASRDPERAIRTQINTGSATGNTVGSYESDSLKSHSHRPVNNAVSQSIGFAPTASTVNAVAFGAGVTVNNSPDTGLTGGNETRPQNVYVNYIIKY